MAADKQRGRQTVRDMVLSLAVIVLGAGVIYLFVPHDEDQDPVKPISYTVELDTARRAASFPVAAPTGLPDRWRPTSVDFQAAGGDDVGGRTAWHLGFISPDGEYAALEQSDTDEPGPFVADKAIDAERTGRTQDVDGQEWRRYEGPKYDALVRTADDVTTVVTGTASWRELGTLAASLEARSAG